jgi:putative hydrolase of the HAD superfamily
MNQNATFPASVPLPPEPEAFAHVDHWIFDLDNTLYSHEAKVWPQVDERITLFLSELFGLDGLSSRALQKYYYQRYGTTLKGLMEEHGIDPDDFLDFAHQIDLTLLDPNPELGEAIAALPGRKLILTNARPCRERRRQARHPAPFRGHLRHRPGRLHAQARARDL